MINKIRRATEADRDNLAEMLKAMFKELGDCTDNIEVYKDMINFNDHIFIHEDGFFVVRDETEPCMPHRKIYNGYRLYIKPHARNGILLKAFYDRLFEEFPDGEIWGITEINSKHIPVMDKRHECVAKVYKLHRLNPRRA